MFNEEQGITFKNSKGNSLAGILCLPTKSVDLPIVILCHGFTSHKNNSKNPPLAKFLAENNIASLRFDFFGHGESDGDFAGITVTEGVDDIMQAINYLKEKGYRKTGLVGNSFGGQCGLVAASKTKDFSALALISPASDYPEVEKARRSKENFDEWREKGFTTHRKSTGEEFRLNYSFWQDIQQYVVYDFANKIDTPTLIVHGTDDETVPVEQSRKTCGLIPDCQLIEIDGADHKYSNQSHLEQMLRFVGNFLVNKLN